MKRLTTLVALAVLWATPGLLCGQEEQPGQRKGQPAGQEPIDARTFVEKAACTNMYEIQASQLAVEKADDPKVKEFARMMIEDHKKANEQLKEAADKAGVRVPTEPTREETQKCEMLKEAEGEEFTRLYKQQQTEAHRKAIQLFETASKTLEAPALKQYATDTLPKLREHQKKLQELTNQRDRDR